MKKVLKRNNAITLIALVITIVILIILAGVIISLSLGENGLLARAKTAATDTKMKAAYEKMATKIVAYQIEAYSKMDNDNPLEELQTYLNADNEIEYAEGESQATADNEDTIVTLEILYAKLKAYPYEFEINRNLKITQIINLEDPDAQEYMVALNESGLQLAKGATATLEASLIPRYLTGYTIGWNSDNTSVATVNNNGVVTAVGVGTATITVIASNGKKELEATCTITVEEILLELSNKYDKYIYIDSVNGNDTTGNGTSSNPYKTLNKITASGVIQANKTYGIILRSGTYELTPNVFGIAANVSSINIIGNRQSTRVRPSSSYNYSGTTYENPVNFYRLIWDCTNQQSGTDVINLASSITFTAVVFDNMGNYSYGYFVSTPNERVRTLTNCTMTSAPSNLFENHLTYKWKITNCYGGFTSGYGTSESSWNYQTNVITSTPSYNSSTYRITATDSVWKNVGTGTNPDGTQANLGVYGGTYSWDYNDDIF